MTCRQGTGAAFARWRRSQKISVGVSQPMNENSGWADGAGASSDEEEVEVVGDNEHCQSKNELLAPMTSYPFFINIRRICRRRLGRNPKCQPGQTLLFQEHYPLQYTSTNSQYRTPPYRGRSNMRMTRFGSFAAKDALMGDGNETAWIWRTTRSCGCTRCGFPSGRHLIHDRAPIKNIRLGLRGNGLSLASSG